MVELAARIRENAGHQLPMVLIHGAFLGVAVVMVRVVALCHACGAFG